MIFKTILKNIVESNSYNLINYLIKKILKTYLLLIINIIILWLIYTWNKIKNKMIKLFTYIYAKISNKEKSVFVMDISCCKFWVSFFALFIISIFVFLLNSQKLQIICSLKIKHAKIKII